MFAAQPPRAPGGAGPYSLGEGLLFGAPDPGPVPGEPPGDALAPTLAEIRARVLGTRAGGAPAEAAPSTEEQRTIYQELQKRHQVDLNDERNLAGLEDPGLLSHMEGARRRLAEQDRALSRLPCREALREDYIKSLGEVSGVLARSEQLLSDTRERVELAFLLPRQVRAFAAGQTPHGATRPLPATVVADPAVGAALAFVEKKGEAVAEAFEKGLEVLSETRGQLFVARRQMEGVCDGLLALLEGAEEERRLLREYLRVASQAETAFHAKGPAGSIGERLLAAPSLPEEEMRSLPRPAALARGVSIPPPEGEAPPSAPDIDGGLPPPQPGVLTREVTGMGGGPSPLAGEGENTESP